MTKILKIPSEFAIQTGDHFFDYETPANSTMDIADIAHSLGNICRWGGHCRHFFSVAQHAIMVSDIAFDLSGSEFVAYVALHHDDHEAVRGDIPSPRKRYLKAHNQLNKGEQTQQDEYIYRGLLGLEWPVDEETTDYVKHADYIALMTERVALQPPAIWAEKGQNEDDSWGETFFRKYADDPDPEASYLQLHNTLKGILESD